MTTICVQILRYQNDVGKHSDRTNGFWEVLRSIVVVGKDYDRKRLLGTVRSENVVRKYYDPKM